MQKSSLLDRTALVIGTIQGALWPYFAFFRLRSASLRGFSFEQPKTLDIQNISEILGNAPHMSATG